MIVIHLYLATINPRFVITISHFWTLYSLLTIEYIFPTIISRRIKVFELDLRIESRDKIQITIEIESLSNVLSYVRSFVHVPMLNARLEFIVGRGGVTWNIFRSLGRGDWWYRKIEIARGQRRNHGIEFRSWSLSGSITLNPIEDGQDTTSEFQSTVFCFPNQRSEKPFGLL